MCSGFPDTVGMVTDRSSGGSTPLRFFDTEMIILDFNIIFSAISVLCSIYILVYIAILYSKTKRNLIFFLALPPDLSHRLTAFTSSHRISAEDFIRRAIENELNRQIPISERTFSQQQYI